MIPQSTQEQLNTIAKKYGHNLLANVQAVLAKDKYIATGELRDSLTLTITPATATEAPIILLQYAEQGYFIGYKNPQWTKQPNIDKLLKWAETKTFTNIPGYKNNSSLPAYKQRERVVWAIAKSQQKFDKWKPKRWKKESKLGELLADLYRDTEASYVREVETILAKAISGVS